MAVSLPDPLLDGGTQASREGWLLRSLPGLHQLFSGAGYTVPANLRVSVGFPVGKRSAIGQCWGAELSVDHSWELFVSPVLDDPVRVLDVLVHELVHATVGLACGHRGRFARCARAVGLSGPMTATAAGPVLAGRLGALCRDLGPFPHAELRRSGALYRKQTTRLVKVACPACGYTVRTTARWISVGLPACPCGARMVPDTAARAGPQAGHVILSRC